MISSAKKGFITLADSRVKRKMWSQNRHAEGETLDRHEHSKCRKSSFVAPQLSRTDRTVCPEYISAAAAVLAGFDDSATVTLNDVRDLLRRHFRNELLFG
jgi:hypothetical protein